MVRTFDTTGAPTNALNLSTWCARKGPLGAARGFGCYGSTRARSQLGFWLFWSLLRPGLRDTPSVDTLSPVVL
jgi:hypothetical protein